MYKDLRKVARPTRKKPGMQEFFILLLVYSYYNKNSHNAKNEFSIPQTAIADYFNCTVLTVKRWFQKLRDLGYINYAKQDNAGKIAYYITVENGKRIKKSYVVPQYKKIRCGDINEIKFLNIYILDQNGLNNYLIDKVDIDVLNYIDSYKHIFDKFIDFLSDRGNNKNLLDELNLENITNIKEIKANNTLTKEEKNKVKRALELKKKIDENYLYLQKKKALDIAFPEFQCKYLEEGCLRLTHEICNTVNPEHTEKINENNYWRSSNARNDMLKTILNTDNIIEFDINGSIYRLTYNLYHDNLLSFDQDIYELIWNNCNFNISWNDKNKDLYRKSFKLILMPIYMKEYTLGYRSNQWEYIHKYYAGHPRKYNRLSKQEKEFYESYKIFIDATGKSAKEFLLTVAKAMHKTLNDTKFIGSDIFTHESNLHILIREKLLLKGIKCANVYDGFYFDKNSITENEFYSIYNESIQELKTNLFNGYGTKIPI